MFTGIITDLGSITSLQWLTGDDTYMKVQVPFSTRRIALGASIAHNGVCLTVIDKGRGWLAYQISGETLSCTTCQYWKEGQVLNLEKALRVGDELGGHLLLGHIDTVTEVKVIEPVESSHRITFVMPSSCAHLIAAKGSVGIDGVSLTVTDVDDKQGIFRVNIIPHTWEYTVFKHIKALDKVNLEIDPIARYIARIVK